MEPEDVLLAHVLPPVGLPLSQGPNSSVTWGPRVETHELMGTCHI